MGKRATTTSYMSSSSTTEKKEEIEMSTTFLTGAAVCLRDGQCHPIWGFQDFFRSLQVRLLEKIILASWKDKK